MSEGKHQYLVVVVLATFSRFIHVYPVKSTESTHAIEAMTTFKISFGVSQKLVYDRTTSFISADFSTFILEYGITHAPRAQ